MNLQLSYSAFVIISDTLLITDFDIERDCESDSQNWAYGKMS